MYDLQEIAGIVGGRLVGGRAREEGVAGFSIDTRSLSRGYLFIAIRGERFDGHDFLPEAEKKGAACAVVSRRSEAARGGLPLVVVEDTLVSLQKMAAFHRRRCAPGLIAITGSCGKTTTKEMLREIAGAGGECIATKDNENNHIGLPLTLLRIRQESRFVVAELGCNHPGEIELLTSLADPDVGLVTCVAPTHTEFLGDVEGVARAKSELFATMRRDAVSVVNMDDSRIVKMPIRTERRVTYGAGADRRGEADVELLSAERSEDLSCQRLRIKVPGDEVDARLNILGMHNARNATAAAAAAFAAGFSTGQIAAGLSKVQPLKGRGVIHGGRFTVLDEAYNSSPAAVLAALGNLRDIAGGRRAIAVLGDMMELGGDSAMYHRRVGEATARVAALLLAVGNFAGNVVEGARSSGMDRGATMSFRRAEEARDVIEGGGVMKDGDIILVKGSRTVRMEVIVEALLKAQE